MAEITAKLVKELRDRTGSGMMDSKKALVETNGDIEAAEIWLRENGILKAAKKSSRVAAEGVIDAYIHAGGKVGVLVEVNSETDFVAKNEEFQNFVKDIAMQIAAVAPKYVSREEVPAEEVEHEKNILTEQARSENKPEHIIEKMVEGRLEKFYEEICLLDQDFIKDSDKKIRDILNDLIAKIGENIKIRRFVRFEVGEGLEKREEDFAAEVAKQIG